MASTFDDATLLIGLGAPRTGTKWVSTYFAQHPDVLMSPLRVLHYFDSRYAPEEHARYDRQFEERLKKELQREERLKRRDPNVQTEASSIRDRIRMMTDDRAYIDYFRKRWSGEKVFSDVTPSYAALSPDVFRIMSEAHPRVKLLFMMRNPIDRFWSGLKLARTRDPGFDAYDAFDARMSGRQQQPGKDYNQTIANLDASVAPEIVHYAFSENLFTTDGVSDLCRFLDVRDHPAEVDKPQNQSEPLPLDLKRREAAFARFEPVFRFVHDRFGDRIPRNWREDMDRFAAGASRAA